VIGISIEGACQDVALLLPKVFAVDRISREDYRIIGESRDRASRNRFSPAALA
jgi:hypothetical protein